MTSIGHCSRSTITLTRPLLLLSLIVFSTAWNLHDPPEFGTLPPSEVDALRKIGKELKKDWDFTQDPCSNKSTSWRSSMPKMPMYVNQVICGDCSLGVCHVVNISLKGQNLTGVLPPSLTKLPYLKVIDLVRNYINGSIPRQWASMKLEYVSVIINRLSGKIPKQLGDMSTLTYLNLESNQFSGEVPAELGKLVNLQSLRLKANNLTGQLPNSLAGLKNLTEFWIGSNNFSGKVPDFFTSWKKLQKLDIQGSGFMGPIPSSISNMTNLIELRISDLRGEGSEFPPFQNMTKLRYLVLRNCNISGFIPENIADNMPVLKTLDLSFNNLKGSVPIGLKNLMTLENMFLTSNLLNGAISDWIQSRSATFMDLSYNNFDESSVPSCYRDNLNLFRSSSRQLSKPLTVHTRNFPCSKVRYSLHINCGGKNTTIGSFKYEGDEEAGGSAKFVPTKAEWGFSSSGNFWSRELTDDYIARNDTVLDLKAKDVDSAQLYTEARKSAMSLTYYGRCLAKGKYNVTLHFAEITFIQSKTFYSLGRRIFDVYIQENLELQDFDIVKEANGTGKVIQKNFPHIEVTETGSIEIRLYYAAKGTTDVPTKGIYGPLISAISVVSEFDPPNRKKMISLAIGCAVSLMVLLFTGFGAIVWRRRQKEREARQEALRGFDLQIGLFTLDQIEAATNSFDAANLIGKGGFGFVYKGTLSDGTHIAVKKLSSRSSQGNKEFVTEIGMISGLHHPNLVRLYGCCIEGSQLFLVYEYMENNNLGRALFDRDNSLSGLNWHTRCRICIGIARGLIFLHEESSLKIVHRDIKPTNVLLDKHLNAKLSDFGLARLREEDDTHIDTRIAGTVGYMAPEYALWGYLTHKADVYSFGVVALEIVAGRSNMSFQRDEHYFCLVDQAFVLQKKGKLLEIIDPRLGSDYNKEEAVRMMQVAILCTNASPTLRPMMSEVVRMLEGDLIVRESTFDPSSYEHWMTEASARQHDQMESELQNVSESRSLIHPSTKFWSDSTS